MIFLLIAGTATPALLIAANGAARLAGLIAIWTLTLTAGAIHMAWMSAPERLVGGTFVTLGWVAGLALPAVWLHSGPAGGSADARGRRALHRRGIVVSPALAEPLSEGFRLPRGLSRLRLVPEFYNRDAPSIGGMPSFYWYQFLWIPLSVACIWIVYRVTRRPR